MKTFVKIVAWIVSLGIVACLVWGYFHFYFVYAEGMDSGELNYIAKQGYVFKTYEAKVIQTGFRAAEAKKNGVQSNEFVFSVEKPQLVDTLMRCTGKQVEVHYKRYGAPLPWRGNSIFVVDSLYSVREN